MIKKITVHLGKHSYDILIGQKALVALPRLITRFRLGSTAILITTPVIKKLHADNTLAQLKKAHVDSLVLTIPDSEKSKNAELAIKLIEKITSFDKGKGVFLVALGGGVVGDLTGFIAAIYKRGIPYIQIPTTLLAQIDSSIGGKTAVDTTLGKNLVGAFYQPRLVISDIDFLKSLPVEQIRAGMAEAVKYAMIKDAAFFDFLNNNIKKILALDTKFLVPLIVKCAAIKSRVVSLDEFDKKGIRLILNFGHTLGHAFEAASHFKISHGQGVALGMVYACKISNELKILKTKETDRLMALLKKIGLATECKNVSPRAVLDAMAHDKKFRNGRNRFILATAIGKTKIIENVPADTIRKVLQ